LFKKNIKFDFPFFSNNFQDVFSFIESEREVSMLKKLVFLIMISIAVAFSSCSNNEKIKDELAEIIKEQAISLCSKEFECCKKSMMEKHYSTEEECVDYITKMRADEYVKVDWTTLDWDHNSLEKCNALTKEILNYECSEKITHDYNLKIKEINDVCSNVFEGTLEIGTKCHSYSYCEKGLYCDKETKICVKYAKKDEPCNKNDILCDPEKNIYCAPDNKCKLLPGLNGDCSYSKKCFKDERDLFCEESDHKVQNDKGQTVTIKKHRCRKLPGPGVECPDNKCDDTSFCNTESTGEGSVKICREKKGNNEDCKSNDECISGRCNIPDIEDDEDDEESDDDEEKEPKKITAKCLGTYKDILCKEYSYDSWQ